jgi:hypothetical protein
MRRGTRHAKIAAALVVVLITAVATTAVLAYFIYERTLSSLVNSRFEFIAKELRAQVQAGLDLGLPLGELENIRTLLRQHMGSDHALVSLSIVSARGVTLFDTEDSRVGEQVVVDWLEPRGKGVIEEPILLNRDQIGVPLRTNYGKTVGGILLTVSHAFYAEKRRLTAQKLMVATAIVLAFGGVIGVLGVLVISQPFDHAFSELEASIRALLLDVDGGGNPVLADDEATAIQHGFRPSAESTERIDVDTCLRDQG